VKRIVKRLLIVAVAALAGIQFVGPARTNPPSDPAKALARRVEIPPPVEAVLDRSCRHCHSNATRWPWYAHVAPVSWAVINHVNEGRGQLNLSDWPSSPEEGADLLDEVCAQVKKGRMPLREYTWIHRDARLSGADRTLLCQWANASADRLMAQGQ
jgi:Haem-binding domain